MSEKLRAELEAILEKYPRGESALIPMLHALQRREGYLTQEGIDEIADVMGMTVAHVEAVISFYTLFRRKPAGRHHIQMCRNLTCHMAGSDELTEWLKERLEIGEDGVSADGLFSLEQVECLAACGSAPALQINLRYYYNADKEKLESLIADLKRGEVAVGERI